MTLKRRDTSIKSCCDNTNEPLNLMEIVDSKSLIGFVFSAVEEVSDKNLIKPVWNISSVYSPKMLLSLLTYGYSANIFSASDLAEKIAFDTDLKYIAGKYPPELTTLIKFRRVNKEAIKHALDIVLKKVKELCDKNYKKCKIEIDGDRRIKIAIMRDCIERDA